MNEEAEKIVHKIEWCYEGREMAIKIGGRRGGEGWWHE